MKKREEEGNAIIISMIDSYYYDVVMLAILVGWHRPHPAVRRLDGSPLPRDAGLVAVDWAVD